MTSTETTSSYADDSDECSAESAPKDLNCRTVKKVVKPKNPVGIVLYTFEVNKRWCWSTACARGETTASQCRVWYPRTWASIYGLMKGINTSGGITGNGWFYMETNGNAKGGHYSWRTQKLKGCTKATGCLKEYNPKVEIWSKWDSTHRPNIIKM